MARKRKSDFVRTITLSAQGVGSGAGLAHSMIEYDMVIAHVNITVGGTLALVPQGSPDGTNFGPYRNELGTALTSTALAVGRHTIAFSTSVYGRHFRLGWTVAASAVTATVDLEFVKGGGGVV